MTPPSVDGTPRTPPGSDDATLRRLAEENARLLDQLSQGKREWEQTVDALDQAFCVVDGNGAVRRANRAMGTLVGQPLTALPGAVAVSLFPEAWRATVRATLAVPGSGPRTLLDGSREFSLAAWPLSDTPSSAMVLVVEDRSEHRRLQDQLLQSEKMSAIGQLIAGVAHDLNNPLASVVGFADYLVEHATSVPPELVGPLTAIRQEAERAAGIVRNLLTFARRQERQRRPVAVAELLNATLQLMNNQFLSGKIEIVREIPANLPHVEADPNQLQQVFLNLLNNAAQAIASTGGGGHITVTAGLWLEGVAVTIRDDGPGIPRELAERVFEPFFTTKRAGEGTGLGLSICQGILREHGGRLTSQLGGPGAVFRVELPRTADPEPEPPPVPPAPSRTLRILVVDDEPHILHYMDATLGAWGHQVRLARNGTDALTAAHEETFDLIICDIRMPDVDGREFYERLRAERPALAERVVFATGDSVRGDTRTFLDGRAQPWLSKPFTLAELRRVLTTASSPPAIAAEGMSPRD